MYTVWYTGEYDLDGNGCIVPVTTHHETFEEAKRAADSWERETQCIATITYEED